MRHADTSVFNTSLLMQSELVCLLLVTNLFKHANEVSICIGDCVYILLKGIDHVTNSNFQLPVGGASLAQASGNTHTLGFEALLVNHRVFQYSGPERRLIYHASLGAALPILRSTLGEAEFTGFMKTFDLYRGNKDN
jgi:hypothetical protein